MRVEKVFLGMVLLFMGLALLTLSSIPSSNVQYGGVIIIGPIPIVVGSSPGMAVFGIMFAAIMLLIIIAMMRW